MTPEKLRSLVTKIRLTFDRSHPCPQLEKTGGEEICSSCLDDLGWLAVEHMDWLLVSASQLADAMEWIEEAQDMLVALAAQLPLSKREHGPLCFRALYYRADPLRSDFAALGEDEA